MKVSNEIFFAAVEERLEAGERVKITLVGTSMRPTLIEGDVLTLEPLTPLPLTLEPPRLEPLQMPPPASLKM